MTLCLFGTIFLGFLLAACELKGDAKVTPNINVATSSEQSKEVATSSEPSKEEEKCELPTDLPAEITVHSKRGSSDRTYNTEDVAENSGLTFHWLLEDDWQAVGGQGTSSVVVIVPNHTKIYEVKVAFVNKCGSGPYRETDARGLESDVISTADKLIAMMNDASAVTKNWNLAIDIDLDNFEWTPVGTGATPFSGVFDGNGHKISNFQINGSTADGLGLIGAMDDKSDPAMAIVRNLTISSVKVNALVAEVDNLSQNAGALVGKTNGGTIENVCSRDVLIKCGTNCGGLIGYSSAKISKSCSSGSVTAFTEAAGGLIGDHRGIINESFADAKVYAKARAGGLTGLAYPDPSRYQAAEINNSYAKGTVQQLGNQAPVEFGGLVGRADQVSIRFSFAAGDVTATRTTADWNGGVGGFVGLMLHGLIDASFSKGSVKGYSNVGGFVGLLTNHSDGFTIVNSSSESITKSLIRTSWSTSTTAGYGSCGGFVGRNRAWIEKSHAEGAVICRGQAGGFVGLAYGENNSNKRSDITDSYSTGAVNATYAQAGSFAGRADAALFTRVIGIGTVTGGSENDSSALVFDGLKVYNGSAPARVPQLGGLFGSLCCTVNFSQAFWDTDTTRLSNYADFWEWNGSTPAIVPIGKTTVELKNPATFSSWDSTNTWILEANSYPKLKNSPYSADVWTTRDNGLLELKWNEF